jgi:ketosteroid isomerase-like protein
LKHVAVLLVAFTLIQAPVAGAKSDGDQRTLERLEVEWNDAHVRGDAAALDRLFGDDLVVVVPGMRVMAKTDALGMFAAGRMKFDRYETSETKFRVYDDTAIVTGRLRRTRVIAGATVDDDWRFTKVYVRRADRWQVVSFHASNTPPVFVGGSGRPYTLSPQFSPSLVAVRTVFLRTVESTATAGLVGIKRRIPSPTELTIRPSRPQRGPRLGSARPLGRLAS